MTGRERSLGAFILAISAAAGMVWFVNRDSPVADWLALPVGTILLWQGVLNLAWLSMGFAVTRHLLPRGTPRLERLCISAAVGVTVFYLGLYFLGVLHLFRPLPAMALALSGIAVGSPSLVRWCLEQRRADRVDVCGPGAAGLRGWEVPATLCGGLVIGLVYLGAFTPAAINFDASWYHLPIAESYAREGRIVGFDGSWQREFSHLAGVIHTWGYIVPGLSHPATRWMMALHTEFALFLWTLVGLAATVNWLLETSGQQAAIVGGDQPASTARPVRGTAAALLLFPGIFVYDGNLGGGSDHVLASFVLPLFLISMRAPGWRSDRGFALWGGLAGAAFMAKYQAIYVLVPLAAMLVSGVVRDSRALRPFGARWIRPAAWLLGAMAVVVAPHFLRNVIFHGNPVYPLLQGLFTASHPAVRDAQVFVEHILADYGSRGPSALGPRIREAFELMIVFAFKPHYSFMGQHPSFGFAFTLALPLLLVIRRPGRLVAAATAALAMLFLWAFTYRVDRHLQTFLPLMAAVSAAVIITTWRMGWVARLGIAGLVVAQLIWASDLWFHGQDRIGNALSLINSGREGRSRTRFDGYFPDHLALDRALPKDAVLFLHHVHPQLGMNRRICLDLVGAQGMIDYRLFGSTRDFYDRLRAIGITHIAHLPGNQAAASMQEEVIFDSFVAGAAVPKARIGPFELFPMPAAPPERRAPLKVVTLGLGGYADGLYDVTALDNCAPLPPSFQHFNPPLVRVGDTAGAPSLMAQSDAVLISGNAPSEAASQAVAQGFRIATSFPGLAVYLRSTSGL